MAIPKETPKILLAAPTLTEPPFRQTVLYLTEHHASSATGFVLNRRTDLLLNQFFSDIRKPLPIHWGGPVGTDRLFFIHKAPHLISDGQPVDGGIWLGGDFEQVKNLLNAGILSEADIRFFTGYCGWSPGQLDAEIAHKYWITHPADFNPVTVDAAGLWEKCLCGKASPGIVCSPQDDPGPLPN